MENKLHQGEKEGKTGELRIEDYLHLYLKAWVTISDCSFVMTDRGWDSGGKYALSGELLHHILLNDCRCESIELRPLSSMTQDEAMELIRLQFPTKTLFPDARYDKVERIWTATTKIPFGHQVAIQVEHGSAPQFMWMLSKSFDLFGLIEAGLAINSTLNPPK